MADETQFGADQYKTSANLKARANLHAKYGHGNWFAFIAAHAGLEAGMKVLDIGCGAGWFWRAAADRLPQTLELHLADMSAGMLDEARAGVAALGGGWQVDAGVADVGALPFADEHFDAVFALHMLYHAKDPARGVAEIARVFKPEGRAVVTTNGADSMAEIYRLGRAAFGGASGEAVAERFGIESGAPLLRAVFGAVDLFEDVETLRVTDGADVVATLTSFPPGQTASAERIAALRALIDTRMAANGGTLDVCKRSGVFVCRK